MMVVGVGVALAWRWLGWQDMVYEGMPGMLAGLVSYYATDRGWLAVTGTEASRRTI